MDNWDDLKFVLALHRAGTMTAAARSLGTNVATVSRRLDRLAEKLGRSVFIKTQAGWEAVPETLGLIRAAEEFDASILREENNAKANAGMEVTAVKIVGSPVMHSAVLIPSLPKLLSKHPNLRPTLINRIRPGGLGDADLLLRFGRPETGRLIARRIGTVNFHAYRPVGSDKTADDGWVSLDADNDDKPPAVMGARIFSSEPMVRVSLFEHMVTAMMSTGLSGVLPDLVGNASPDFEPTPGAEGRVSLECWMAFHQSRRDDVALRAAADWAVESFAATDWANIDDEIEIAAE